MNIDKELIAELSYKEFRTTFNDVGMDIYPEVVGRQAMYALLYTDASLFTSKFKYIFEAIETNKDMFEDLTIASVTDAELFLQLLIKLTDRTTALKMTDNEWEYRLQMFQDSNYDVAAARVRSYFDVFVEEHTCALVHVERKTLALGKKGANLQYSRGG